MYPLPGLELLPHLVYDVLKAPHPYVCATDRETQVHHRHLTNDTVKKVSYVLLCNTRFMNANRMHLICAPGSVYIHMINHKVNITTSASVKEY